MYKALEECRADARVLLVHACRNDPLAGRRNRLAGRRPLTPAVPRRILAGMDVRTDEQLAAAS
jgi:hypothetical protein